MASRSQNRALGISAIALGAIWLVLQVIVVTVYQDIPQAYDSVRYQHLAEEMAKTGTWYPTAMQIEDPSVVAPYIIYPGFINYLIIIIRVFGSIKAAFWINIFLNVTYAASGTYIATKLCNKRIGYLYFILFCLSHQNILDVGFTLSELPALALAYSGACLCSSNKKLILGSGGILLGISYYFRPSALLILITAVILIISLKKVREKLLPLLAGTALSVFGILALNHYISEKYWFLSSNTLGINMYLGANDESTGLTGGTTDWALDEEISRQNSFGADSVYKNKATEWILNNPMEWIQLGAKKLEYQTSTDTFIHMYRTDENPVIIHDDNFLVECIKLSWLWFPRIYDWFLVLSGLYGLWVWRSRLRKGYWPILIPVVGTLGLCVLTIADYRYNSTMMPVLYFLSAIGLNRILENISKKYSYD